MRKANSLLDALGRSSFRRRFRLGPAERRYLREHGLEVVMIHAQRFVEQRLADAKPHRDGRQTPWRGHPVFIAQHATATCCRNCIARWHGIKKGRPLNKNEIDHLLSVIRLWLERQQGDIEDPGEAKTLFD